MKTVDITDTVKCGSIDGENMPLLRCACGIEYDDWDFILYNGKDDLRECRCGRKMYFSYTVKIFEVVD